jgi:glutathione S-transferase
VRYAFREYTPLVDEPWLRWRLGAPTGRVSTPTLFADGVSYRDSLAVAQYAERRGGAAPLFPTEHATAIAAWNARSESALCRPGAFASSRRMSEVPGAKTEIVPPRLPRC